VIGDDGKIFQCELVGDKAYPFSPFPDGWHLRVTMTAKGTKDVNEKGEEIGQTAEKAQRKNVHFDAGIARLRGVVERSIRRVKLWPIFHTPNSYCMKAERVEKMVVLSCALSNWLMKRTGLQQI